MGDDFAPIPLTLAEHVHRKYAEHLTNVARVAGSGDQEATRREIDAATEWFADFFGHLVVLTEDEPNDRACRT